MAMRSVSAAPRPTLDVDDSVTVSLATAPRGTMSIADLEAFIAEIRGRGGADEQSVTWALEGVGNFAGDTTLRISARIGWNVVLPED